MPYYWLSKEKVEVDMPEISKEKLKEKKEKKTSYHLFIYLLGISITTYLKTSKFMG